MSKGLTPSFKAKIEKGEMILYNRESFVKYVKTRKDGEYTLRLAKQKKNRSNNQNAYYWGCVIEILSSELGYFPDETHEALKWKFLKTEDTKLPRTKSTAMMSTVEFEDYLTHIRNWAASEMDIRIPLPNEVDVSDWV